MTPEEKAKDLLSMVDTCVCGDINEGNKKDMAEIICNEVIEELSEMDKEDGYVTNRIEYWNEVIKFIK